ncbi:MAG: Lrp/AsnC family transcriptional regulator [Thermoanaerobaculia bacterium]|jgi:Lrp/AsnC family leucine-responsive transcriptional regulator|nr:MAG: Lrp/AsnC family transcriptional regulator [Thermoanaerobaculia bacterium]MBZ0101579.1 Lrp/AsnC family transcriptional regulator [Thermoanaerobaculia bacterium]
MLDERDLQILDLLQRDARTSNAELGRTLGIAPSAVLERIRKLERRGVIRGYAARLDPALVGSGLLAYIFVQADEQPGGDDLGERLAGLHEVQEVHHVAGEDCYLVKVRCASTEELGRLLKERVGVLPEVRRTRTTVVLGTIRESGDVPLPAVAGEVSDEPV